MRGAGPLFQETSSFRKNTMSRKDNLRDPSRRARILARRATPLKGLFPVMNALGRAPSITEKLKARLSKSKYKPHVGKKQFAKLQAAA
jgi:hypothetical protein